MGKLNNDCMELIDYIKWIVPGGQFRDIAASHMGPLSTKLIDKWTDMVLGKSEDLISSSTSECVSETFTEKCILGETHTEPEQKKEDLEETKEEDESKNDESKVDEPKVDESKDNESDDDDSKDDDSNEEDTTQEEKPKEEPQKDEESKKEEDSKCEKIEGADGKTYYGTVASGFTSEQVVAGADKLISLLGMTGSFLGAEVGAQITSCAADYKADIVRQLLPRCDDKCQPMKQCESSCKALKSKCVPSSLQGYFPMVKKGGRLRSMLPMIGLSESAPEMKVIDAWLEKLNECKSEQLTSATVCLSKNYKGKMCNPDEPKTIEEPKEEEPKEENQKIIPSKKCKTIRGVSKRKYVGTIAP